MSFRSPAFKGKDTMSEETKTEEVQVDPKTQAIQMLASICQEYVNVLQQSGKAVSANLIVQQANQAVTILQAK